MGGGGGLIPADVNKRSWMQMQQLWEAGVLKTGKAVDITKNLTEAVALPPQRQCTSELLQTTAGRA